MKKICICIPIYNETPSEDELLSLYSVKINAKGVDTYYIKPCSLGLDGYINYPFRYVNFDDEYFQNVEAYSRLLLSTEFYEKFVDYEYMLICQTDALLLKPFGEWKYLLEKKHDYIGAPWPDGGLEAYALAFRGVSIFKRFLKPQHIEVGNGGFSLRNVRACISLIEDYKFAANTWNTGEDIFFSYYGLIDEKFKVAPVDVAYEFACEKDAREQVKKGKIPIGIHAWEKYYPEVIKELNII